MKKEKNAVCTMDGYLGAADNLLLDADSGIRCLGNRQSGKRQSRQLNNCIDCYRRVESLTLQQLAEILGGSRQWVQSVCRSAKPSRKVIEALSRHEGISIPEFLDRYGVSDRRCA